MLAIKEVNDVIAGSTEVSDDPFVGGGHFFYHSRFSSGLRERNLNKNSNS